MIKDEAAVTNCSWYGYKDTREFLAMKKHTL
jgi:hypothetical protein